MTSGLAGAARDSGALNADPGGPEAPLYAPSGLGDHTPRRNDAERGQGGVSTDCNSSGLRRAPSGTRDRASRPTTARRRQPSRPSVRHL